MMKSNMLTIACMAAALGIGWGMAQDDASSGNLLAPEQAAKVNSVGWNLLKESLSEGNDNIAISPASIRAAFCPLQYGLSGNSSKEVEDVMGDGAAFDRFIITYNKAPNGANLANRLLVDKTVILKEAFVKAVPGDLLKTADFKGNPAGECKDLNKWIEKNTNGLIKDMLSPDVFSGGDLKFISANAAAFEGNWKTPFDEKNNIEDVFHGTKGNEKITMMSQKLWGLVDKRPDSSVVLALSYTKPESPEETSDICFVAAMPGEGVTLRDFANNSTWSDFSGIFDNKANYSKEFKLSMPKFTIETPLLNLTSQIQKLGVRDLFEGSKADFSKMTDAKDLFVSDVYHKCYIKVFEKGTKAAAVTIIALRSSLALDETIVKLDRPFLWFIYDQKQRLILFCGTYSMPEK